MKNTISKIFAILLFTFPLVCNYDVFRFTPSLLYCVIGFLLLALYLLEGKKLSIDLRAMPYLVYIVISATIGIVHSKDNTVYTLFMKLALYVLTLIVFYLCYWQVMDQKFAMRLYTAITVIVTAIVIVQYVFAAMGRGFCLVVPGIPVAGVEDLMTDQIRSNQLVANRYSSFFFEPAHQAQFVLPCLTLILLGKPQASRKSLALAVFITIGLLCTTSMIGILGAAIIWLFYVYVSLKSKKARQWYFLLILLPLLAGGVLYYISRDDLMRVLNDRLGSLNLFSQDRSEGFRRMKYGWFCYGELDGVRKLLGVGYQNIGDYLSNSGIGYKLLGTNDPQYLSYTNGITKMLIGMGLVGTVMNLNLFFFDAVRSKDKCVYGLLLVWGIVMFTSNAFDDLGNINLLVLIMCKVYGEKKIKMKHTLSIAIR